MYIVGLTGGIGSGKTTVAKMFETLGIPVYYADTEAKQLMHTNTHIKNALIKQFGKEVYQDGMLNRAYLAEIVFHDKEKLVVLNSIVHPEVRKHFEQWTAKQQAVFVLKENAILFESDDAKNCHATLVVTAPIETRITRVIARDNTTAEAVKARINNQWDDSKKIERADFVIHNTNLTETIKQVKDTYQKIILRIK